jgi:hypothetical protein
LEIQDLQFDEMTEAIQSAQDLIALIERIKDNG